MQEELNFLVTVLLFTGLSTFFALYITSTANPIRQWAYIAFGAILAAVSALYFAELRAYTSLTANAGGPFFVLMALCFFVAVGCVVFIVDLYVNVDELRHDRAYNTYGDTGLAIMTIGTAQLALFFAVVPWFLSDPSIFEIKGTIRYLDGVASLEEVRLLDIYWFAADQTGKAILFDIAEVYRLGVTNISNNPEHLTFSTFCLVYRTLVAVYVAVIAYRLIFVRAVPK